MKKENINEATAPKAVAVAKAVKAESDPKTGEELISMNIQMYENDSDDMVKNDDLEKRIKRSISDLLIYFSDKDITLNTREDAIKFDELSEGIKCWPAHRLLSELNHLSETCQYLELRVSITLAENVAGIRQINIDNGYDYNIVTENCFKILDENTNLIIDKCIYFGKDDQILKIGSKLLHSYMIGDCFNIFYDAIDISRDKRMMTWFDNA